MSSLSSKIVSSNLHVTGLLSNGWAPPPTVLSTSDSMPFRVDRTSGGFIPVYLERRNGGTREFTVLKNLTGRLDMLVAVMDDYGNGQGTAADGKDSGAKQAAVDGGETAVEDYEEDDEEEGAEVYDVRANGRGGAVTVRFRGNEVKRLREMLVRLGL